MAKRVLSPTLIRYILPYFAILVAVFVCMGIFLFSYFMDTLEKNFYETNVNILGRIRYTHESNLNSMLSITDQFNVRAELQPFPLARTPLRALEIMKLLSTYRILNVFFRDIILFYNVDDYLYSPNTSIHIDMFLSRGLIYDSVGAETLRTILSEPGTLVVLPAQTASGMFAGSARDVVTFIQPIGDGKRGSMLFIVDERQYRNIFAQEADDTRNMYILHDGKLLIEHTMFDLPESFVEARLSGNERILTETVAFGNEEYLVSAIAGEMGMQYCAVQQKSVMMASLSAQQRRFWFFLALTCLISMALMTWSSLRNYKPVRMLRGLFATQAKDDFKAIEKGIKDMAEQNEALANRLDQSLALEKSEFVRRFVNGNFQDSDALYSMAEQLGLDVKKRYYAVVLLSAQPGVADYPDIWPDAGGFQDENVGGYYMELATQNQVLFAMFSDEQNVLLNHAQEILHIARVHHKNAVMAISRMHENINQATTAYLEAATAYDSRFLLGNTGILRFEDVKIAGNTVPYPTKIMGMLKNVLRSGDAGSVDGIIDELLQYIQTMSLSLFAFRSFYNDIISVIINECAPTEAGGDPKLYDIYTLSGCLSLEELNETLRRVCHSLLGRASAADEENALPVRTAEEYMLKNYRDPNLNMAFMADQFNMSMSAFSKKFKEQTGVNPSEYLLHIRIDKAKKMLAGTQLSVKDICLNVGYNDVSGFIQRFKRYMGMTPAAYRTKIKE